MKKQNLTHLLALAGLFGATGCALDTGDQTLRAAEDAPSEHVATAAQPLLGSAHAQGFGVEFGTPDPNNSIQGFAGFGHAVATGDLNGDGAADMVVGIPGAGPGIDVGVVDIVWGQKAQGASFGGLSNSSVTQLRQPGAGNPEWHDSFGASVAVGDFNCDGHPDLAVGAPGDTLNSENDLRQGNVSILYGPTFTGWQLFWQGSAGIPGVPEVDDGFGSVLSVGNFNGDTWNGHACADLAIGAPQEGIGSAILAGSVTILYGRSTGLNTSGAPAPQLWHQDVGTLFGVAEAGDHFGSALAAGDFNHDGKDDLAIGAPYEDYESVGMSRVGVVQVISGASGGLNNAGNYALELNDLSGLPLQEAKMGVALAAGDFDGDGDADLAVGADLLASGTSTHAGGVLVYRQVNGILTAALRYDQNSANVPGMVEPDDQCGASLVAGDFNGDGRDDLASGCPGEVVTASGTVEGALNIVSFGVVSGALTVASGQLWHKDSTGIPGQCGILDFFSETLAAGDFNGDGKTDLAASGELGDATSLNNYNGSVIVLYGAP